MLYKNAVNINGIAVAIVESVSFLRRFTPATLSSEDWKSIKPTEKS